MEYRPRCGAFGVRAEWADSSAETERLARTAANEGVDIVVAMGGDGVVHDVANGLAGTDAALGIIPAGTTNVVAKILGIPQGAPQAAEALAGYVASPHTLAHVTAETAHGIATRHALFALGVGFDADVVAVAETRPHSKVTFGAMHYARSALSQIFGDHRRRAPNLIVESNGRSAKAVAVMVQVFDRYTYFGRVPMFLTKPAPIGLTAVAVHRPTPSRAFDIMRRAVANRTLVDAPGCTVFHDVDKLVVAADPAGHYQADGEPLGLGTSFEITPAKSAIRILTPG